MITATLYRLTAPVYETAMAPVFAPLAADLVHHGPPASTETILDLGTGTGFVLRVAAPRARCSLGVDISLPMLQAAAAVCAAQHWPHTLLLQADASTLDIFADNWCDVVYASFGLGDCPPERALHAAARVLRPGGQLAIQEWGPYDVPDPRLIVDEALSRFAEPQASGLREEFRALLAHPRPWESQLQDVEDYDAALTEAGFRAIQIAEFRPVTLRLPIQTFLSYALAWAPRALEVAALSLEARQQFLALVEQLLYPLADTTGRLSWSPLVIRAVAVRA